MNKVIALTHGANYVSSFYSLDCTPIVKTTTTSLLRAYYSPNGKEIGFEAFTKKQGQALYHHLEKGSSRDYNAEYHGLHLMFYEGAVHVGYRYNKQPKKRIYFHSIPTKNPKELLETLFNQSHSANEIETLFIDLAKDKKIGLYNLEDSSSPRHPISNDEIKSCFNKLSKNLESLFPNNGKTHKIPADLFPYYIKRRGAFLSLLSNTSLSDIPTDILGIITNYYLEPYGVYFLLFCSEMMGVPLSELPALPSIKDVFRLQHALQEKLQTNS